MNHNSAIVPFYLQKVPDDRGRMIAYIWQQDHTWLEKTHDYIQWLFPLTEKSRFNPNAPLLTELDLQKFGRNPDLQTNLLRSLLLMLDFYGLSCQVQANDEVIVTIAPSFPERKKNWVHWGNHNHLRITRILKSLKLLGLEAHAYAFFQCLGQIYELEKGKLTKLTFSYWQEAVNN